MLERKDVCVAVVVVYALKRGLCATVNGSCADTEKRLKCASLNTVSNCLTFICCLYIKGKIHNVPDEYF